MHRSQSGGAEKHGHSGFLRAQSPPGSRIVKAVLAAPLLPALLVLPLALVSPVGALVTGAALLAVLAGLVGLVDEDGPSLLALLRARR